MQLAELFRITKKPGVYPIQHGHIIVPHQRNILLTLWCHTEYPIEDSVGFFFQQNILLDIDFQQNILLDSIEHFRTGGLVSLVLTPQWML